MEHRFSLSINSPRLSNPIADSTWIDGPPTANRSMAFQLSPKQRSNSSICLSSSYTNTNETPQNKTLHQTSRTSTSISRMTRQKLNLSQLDPKTYADVHSSGIASRIVKYHQESRPGLQRSMSFNNVYNPITQPRRTSIVASPLSHKPNLPSLSMTRIAPPERSFYCGNTLPSLLRSNSLLGVEKCSEQLSRENRPIMHPQPLQHDSEPTRSVLEELKEISRKRINSGDIQQNDYNTKKSCNRMTDFVDHHNVHSQQQQLSMLQPQSGFKRQRELTVAVPLHLHHAPMSLPPLPHHHQQLQQQQQQQHHQLQQQQQQQQLQMPYASNSSPQQSPEQLAKRRNCSYSNDITSSLSSSKLHSNKRKLYDMRQQLRLANGNTSTAASANGNSSSPENSPHQHASKIQRKQPASDLRLEQLTKTQSTPITPLPATPATSAQRTVSAPVLPQEEAPPKPKLTLFNAQQQREQRNPQLDLDSPDVDANEYAGIQFVKPKQQNSFNGVKNSNLERTQKTKLALMLSSLKGEIYQDEPEPPLNEDEPDAQQQPTVTKATVTGVTTTTSSATTTKPVILSVTTILPATKLEASTAATSAAATTATSKTTTSNIATTTSTTSNSGAVIDFKLPAAVTNAATTATATPQLNFAGPKAVEPIATTAATKSLIAPIAAIAPALSFGKLPAITTAAAVTATTTTTTMLSFGITAIVTTATITTSAPLFSFGKATTTAAGITAIGATTTTATIAAPATTPMFSFGSAATTAAATTATAAPITTTTPGKSAFSFGSGTTTTDATIPALGGFSNSSFASAFKAPTPATTAATTTPAAPSTNTAAEPSKLFSFGGNTVSTAAATATATAKPMFGQPATTAATPTAATPIFGQAAATAATPTFGQVGTTTNTPSFGQVATAATTPSFGQAATAATPTAATTSMFGQAAAKPSFSFNATTATNAAAPAAATTANNSNMFTFGGSAGGAGSKPVAKAAPFSMPSSSNNNSNTNNSGNNVFGFGGSSNNSTATATATNNFSFNATTAAPPTAAATNTSNFSFNATSKPTPVFGGNNSNSNATAAKPFAFGGNAAATEQQQSTTAAQAPRAGGFSFAAVAQKSESTNMFGTPTVAAATAPTAATGIVKPTFNFGGSTATPAAAAGTTTAATPATTFGNFATPAAPASKPFAFGGVAPTARSNNVIGGNLFASAVAATQQQQQQQQQPKPGGFSFSTTNSNNNSSNSSVNNSSIAATPANNNAPFAFGGMTATPQSNNTTKPFTFGASANAAPPTNMFGNAATVAAPSNAGAFNFGGTAASTTTSEMPATPQQLNSGNVFVLPNTPEGRPIRRATRRLQK